MTTNISSLQSELLKLMNDKGADENEISIENVLPVAGGTVDEIANPDLKGGQNIRDMVDNVLTGGGKQEAVDSNSTSESEIMKNILLEDAEKVDEDDATAKEVIEMIHEDGTKGGNKSDSTSDDEEEEDESDDSTSEDGEESKREKFQYSDDTSSSSSDYSDDEEFDNNLSEKYISIINEFKTQPKLTGGLVGGDNSSSQRVSIIPVFPYLVRT